MSVSSDDNMFGAEFLSLDDLMLSVFEHLLSQGVRFKASKGGGVELLGLSLRLTNPRARLSRSETRGKIFSALGELFWYLSGSNDLNQITYYLPKYKYASDDKVTVYGAYGPRIFGKAPGMRQVDRVLRLLGDKSSSRRAAIQLFSGEDLEEDHADVPCTCTLQLMVRNGFLNMIVYMRSNDAYFGLPHDVFSFTMLQEMMARSLGVDVGFYQHMVGNMHLYDEVRASAEDYVKERYQAISTMPPMPPGDPWRSLPVLLAAEAAIRADPDATVDGDLGPYWGDIVRLFRVYSERAHRRTEFEARILSLRAQMHHRAYDVYFL